MLYTEDGAHSNPHFQFNFTLFQTVIGKVENSFIKESIYRNGTSNKTKLEQGKLSFVFSVCCLFWTGSG